MSGCTAFSPVCGAGGRKQQQMPMRQLARTPIKSYMSKAFAVRTSMSQQRFRKDSHTAVFMGQYLFASD
jgi:hypothetical protein